MNFKDIINLSEQEKGKVFVVDESGNVKAVILSFDEYSHKMLGNLKAKVQDPETVNQEILRAQLAEPAEDFNPPIPISEALNKKAQMLFRSRPASAISQPDLRAEVIDPNFDFEAPRQDLEDF